MDFDEIPQRGLMRDFLAPLLGLPTRHRGHFGRLVLVNADGDDSDVALEAMRWREARIRQANGVPGAVAGVVAAVTDAVAGAVDAVTGRVTKIEAAKAWLISRLVDGPVDAVTIEEDGKKAGHSLKNLKTAKQRIKAGSLRRGHSWFWHLPMRARGKES